MTTAARQPPPGDRIATPEKIGYALGDAASSFYWRLFELFMVFFFTDVAGVSPAATGTMLLVSRALDAAADPLIGALADRTSTRWGKFRPYLVWFSLPLAVAGVLAFSTSAVSGASRLAYGYVTTSLLMLLYSAVNIPYSALLGVITPRSVERTGLATARFLGAFAGGLLVQKLTLDLVRALGGGDAGRGWTLTLAVYGAAAVALFAACFALTRERVAAPPAQSAALGEDVRALARNRPWAILFAMAALLIVALWLRGGSAAYYFKYYLRDEAALGWYLASGGIASLAAIAATGPLARRFGKRRLYRLLMAAAGIATCAFSLVPVGDLRLAFALNLVISALFGPIAPLIWAMFADVADYGEHKTGRRATGLLFASTVFSMKLGGAVGGWALGLLLAAFGYSANAAQTAGALRGIALIAGAIPGAICLLVALLAGRYELDEARVRVIEAELAVRRESE